MRPIAILATLACASGVATGQPRRTACAANEGLTSEQVELINQGEISDGHHRRRKGAGEAQAGCSRSTGAKADHRIQRHAAGSMVAWGWAGALRFTAMTARQRGARRTDREAGARSARRASAITIGDAMVGPLRHHARVRAARTRLEAPSLGMPAGGPGVIGGVGGQS